MMVQPKTSQCYGKHLQTFDVLGHSALVALMAALKPAAPIGIGSFLFSCRRSRLIGWSRSRNTESWSSTQGHPQGRHVLRRSASLRDARHHRSCQLACEAPCEHSRCPRSLGRCCTELQPELDDKATTVTMSDSQV